MNKKLKFHENGTFKIIQLTDLHMSGEDNHPEDEQTLSLIDHVINYEKPDLLVYSGDLIWSEGVNNPSKSFRRVLDAASKWNIPFAIIYGNHDSEENITRNELQHIQSEYSMSLSEEGPSKINGIGNYTLTIGSSTSDKDEAIIYFFDSGALAPEIIGGYDWIRQNQVNWYVAESQRFATKNNSILPSLAFFHIPIPEYNDVWQYGSVTGTKREDVSSPKINSGLFTAMIENGDVMGTFAGHDHDNDYCGELNGISLCFGRVTGYHCYGELQRGVRVIRLHEGKRHFDSWIRLDDGTVISPYSNEREAIKS
ncbi:metallophosphoesterase family protein [Sporosarcina sp. Marseille-Q4063]|uniref:metallophosphoesterase family protein n=1 Tax=Sporosarcina sp. Marseille-Q4063 TaxID=2810514 RepID=UPI001BB0CA15|nr:metallophosphoesterase family protein [Sporosarcina sp. Marseille-Q4063]QUW21511.1 metallophosphoesterase family protein [Sporosarcina sp. Marseille-Q4063]